MYVHDTICKIWHLLAAAVQRGKIVSELFLCFKIAVSKESSVSLEVILPLKLLFLVEWKSKTKQEHPLMTYQGLEI